MLVTCKFPHYCSEEEIGDKDTKGIKHMLHDKVVALLVYQGENEQAEKPQNDWEKQGCLKES